MQQPEYNVKMQLFFATAFEQTQVNFADFGDQFNGNLIFQRNQAQFLQNAQEMFARTAMQLIAEGQPFTSMLTTQRFAMTPALMAAYATSDSVQNTDDNVTTDLFHKDTPTAITIVSDAAIPIADLD